MSLVRHRILLLLAVAAMLPRLEGYRFAVANEITSTAAKGSDYSIQQPLLVHNAASLWWLSRALSRGKSFLWKDLTNFSESADRLVDWMWNEDQQFDPKSQIACCFELFVIAEKDCGNGFMTPVLRRAQNRFHIYDW